MACLEIVLTHTNCPNCPGPKGLHAGTSANAGLQAKCKNISIACKKMHQWETLLGLLSEMRTLGLLRKATNPVTCRGSSSGPAGAARWFSVGFTWIAAIYNQGYVCSTRRGCDLDIWWGGVSCLELIHSWRRALITARGPWKTLKNPKNNEDP